ncbi:hypothetical protein F5Y14DRAFT_463304 [Nemania sp. NC0429]|nr:hypothetical protein F5Y14DRAFT_463304 [Nemania sp. NC0429]
MFRAAHSSRPAEAVYFTETRYRKRDTVWVKTIGNRRPGTSYPILDEIKPIDEEISAAAKSIAEVQIDSPSSDVLLTSRGYAKKGVLRDALIGIDYDNMRHVLKRMLKDGAHIYQAIYRGDVVGVVVMVRLPGEFPNPDPLSERQPTHRPHFPSLSDAEAVEAYARSKRVDQDFTYKLRRHLNRHVRYHERDRLWEMSYLGVKDGFRRQNIGKTLVQHALSLVLRRETVVILTEPGTEALYQQMQFSYSMYPPQVRETISIQPEWAARGDTVKFHIMILDKIH